MTGCRKAGLCPLPLSSPLTGLSCGQARLRVDHEAAPDRPTQLLSPLAWPSAVVSLNKPERQSPGSAELLGYLGWYSSCGLSGVLAVSILGASAVTFLLLPCLLSESQVNGNHHLP